MQNQNNDNRKIDVRHNYNESIQGNYIEEQNNYFTKPKENSPIISNIPRGSKNFVGREKELTKIDEILQDNQGIIVCAVEGLGGIGKSELAVQYANQSQEKYQGQYWLSLQNSDLPTEIYQLASSYLVLPEGYETRSLIEQVQYFWQHWLPDEGNLLFILDNVVKMEQIPESAMPTDKRVKMLVTTRERSLNVEFESLPLETLPLENCLELLAKIVGKAKVEAEKETVIAICETLGYLPLGVELIGVYLAENRFKTFAQLQTELNLKHDALTKQRQGKIIGNLGVMAAIELSWANLQKSATLKVAMLLSLFAPTEILWELVADIAEAIGISEGDLNTARSKLDNSHLIKPVDESSNFYTIHPLVREFFALQLRENNPELNSVYRPIFVQFLLNIAKTIPQTLNQEMIAKLSPVIKHLEYLSETMLDDIPNPEENLYWAFWGVTRYYDGQGKYQLAEIPAEKCVQETESRLGANHPYTIDSLNILASLYNSQGRYPEAEPLLIRSLAIREEQLGANHPHTASSLNNLALLYTSQGRYKEAEPLYLRALAIREEQLGANHPDTALSLNSLAELYRFQGRYPEAEPLYVRSLAIIEEQLGENHPDTAANLNSLAELYRSQGRYPEAEPLYVRSLAIIEEQLGANHPHTASGLNNLALLYYSQGHYKEAEPLYRRALAIYEEQLGANHPHTAQSLNNLAELYHSQGRYPEAEPLYRQALAIREEQLGANHPHTASSLNNLALLYYSQGHYKEAEPLYRRALAIYEEQLGANHPDTALSLDSLALLYTSQGRYTEAEPLLVRSLTIREEQLGENHPNTAANLNNLAELYRSQGRYTEAEPLLVRSLAIYEEQLGTNHPHTATSLNNLAGLYYSQGRYKEAEPLLVRALTIFEEQLGANHPYTATSLNTLAELYCSQGQLKKAEEFAQRALNIDQSTLGNHHPDTISSLLTVKSVQMQMVLGCDQQTLFDILQEIAQMKGITELNNEIYIQLLELMKNNPPLIEVIKQRLSL